MSRWVPVFAVLLLGAGPAIGQTLPSEPIVFGGGRVTIGGDVSATFSCAHASDENGGQCADDPGFFNYSDYEHSALRRIQVDVSASIRAGERVAFLAEIRSENGGIPDPYALYLRVTPWVGRGFDIQVGRVPPTFGGFARRIYPADNPLIGYPLAYQYLTSLRPDSLPANADELLRMRGRGWLSNFSVGNPLPDRGVPLVSAFSWDTGVQVHARAGILDAAGAVTAGTLANPLVKDDNRGKQVAGRVTVKPLAGLVLGASAARGPFVTQEASRAAANADNGSLTQTAWGADAEYSRDYYLIRFEAIVSSWRMPPGVAPVITDSLRATSTSLEGRYRISPGLYAAARLDSLNFSTVRGERTDSWDAPVTRVEVGGGYSLQRNLVLKLALQHNTRKTTRMPALNLTAAQILFWF